MNESSKKIAVVDDTAFFRNQVKKALQDIYEEVDFTEYKNGKEAFNGLPHDEVEFVTMDVVMPEMNGIELLQALKENHPDWKTPILVVSADIQESTKKTCKELGAVGFIEKPFKKEQIISVLDQLGL